MRCSCKGVFFSEIRQHIFLKENNASSRNIDIFFVITAMDTFYFGHFYYIHWRLITNAEGFYRLVFSLLYLSNVRAVIGRSIERFCVAVLDCSLMFC